MNCTLIHYCSCAQLWCVLLLLKARPRPPLALAQLRMLEAAMQGMAQGGQALPKVLVAEFTPVRRPFAPSNCILIISSRRGERDLCQKGAAQLLSFLGRRRKPCAVCGTLGHHLRCSACKGARICGRACLRKHVSKRQCSGMLPD